MTLLQTILLGLQQGLTEFFPVFSLGRQMIPQKLIGLEHTPQNLDAFLRQGIITAIFWMIYYAICFHPRTLGSHKLIRSLLSFSLNSTPLLYLDRCSNVIKNS